MIFEYEVTINQDAYYVTIEPSNILEQQNSDRLYLHSVPNNQIICAAEPAPWVAFQCSAYLQRRSSHGLI